jgi:hypothetical protein
VLEIGRRALRELTLLNALGLTPSRRATPAVVNSLGVLYQPDLSIGSPN